MSPHKTCWLTFSQNLYLAFFWKNTGLILVYVKLVSQQGGVLILCISFLYAVYMSLSLSFHMCDSSLLTHLRHGSWHDVFFILPQSITHSAPCVCVSGMFSFFVLSLFLCHSNLSFHNPSLTPLRVYVSQPACYQQNLQS